MKRWLTHIALLALVLASYCAYADINIHFTIITEAHKGAEIGQVIARDSKYGLLLIPNLHGLPPGLHGLHLHEKPDCGNDGMAAGPHFDPKHTNLHQGPYSDQGHLGDLPALYVDDKGNATLPILAPRFTLASFKHHALMIHAGGDNYTDNPPMGGGGSRLACGVIN